MKKHGLRFMSITAAIALVFAISLAACGKPKAGVERKKLSFAIALSEEEWKVMREDIFPKFTQKTGIEIEGLQIENADIETKVESLKGRGEIDIIAPDNMLLYGLVKKGLVKDLSAHAASIPAEINKANYEYYKIDGKLYFMPFRPNVKINFYNETKFNAAGLAPPKTWDELMNVAKTFYNSDKVGRIGLQANQGAPTTVEMFEYIRAAGGDPLILNDPGSVKAYTFLKELWPYISNESLRANFSIINQALATDAVYYASNWPFTVNIVVQDGQKTELKAYAGFMGPEKISKVLGGNVLAICADTKQEAAALEFARFLVTKEIQEILVTKNAWPACREDAYGTIAAWQKPYFEAVNEALNWAEPRPIVHYWSDVDKAINDSFRAIVIDGGDVKTNLDKFAANIAAGREKAQ